ncbi:uncharacterized protein [Gossypium hirsutum]|uniref:Integrase catalytic domain-containing protein n=1 Tax=Gossypium hirsutum TaxID=3635 RepID=A0ABM2ZG02_GOSHI|nr:uncharacterized protein LOC121212264 [Gossypium hirsutum]
MCLDYRDLNKASPKDNFPLPHIDTLVDNTAGYSLFSFMDGFSGYNQIKMHSEDMEKTMFITLWETFCYKVIPFGLKNAGATYQKAMVTLFHDMMHKEIEVYVDDMIAKSRTKNEHLQVLRRLFLKLKKFQLKLNPTKCTFRARSGKLLGFVVSEKRVIVDLDKVRAIQELPPPRTQKESREYPVQATENDKRTLRRLANDYVLDGEVLYKRRKDQVLLRCVDAVEAKKILEEVHEGVCRTHANGFTMAWQIMRFGVIVEVCRQFKIKHHNSSPYRPKMNGAVEAANKNIKRIVGKMTETYKDWHEKLPFALYAYQTSVKTSTDATPYSLVYGMEAVLPIEVEIPSFRVLSELKLDEAEWIQSRYDQLNLIEEKRLKAIHHGQMTIVQNSSSLRVGNVEKRGLV